MKFPEDYIFTMYKLSIHGEQLVLETSEDLKQYIEAELGSQENNEPVTFSVATVGMTKAEFDAIPETQGF